MDMDNLNKIALWIKKKTNNTDYLVYTDEGFYHDVYPQLQSDLKKPFFILVIKSTSVAVCSIKGR
ncbi:hypothetical protein J2Z69_001886 [Paenibacillus shirakamiensis]|uniref:Uncharacterized protein n=1 Tax=Paenibacillus shirakamiensis TaxID=1265935 RepID=A0ABS4JGK8_9BACL|nr:hypothetical protein [Paenibacillus shirakamiensis]